MPLQYYRKGDYTNLMEESTRTELEHLLKMLAEKGPDVTEAYIRNVILRFHPGARLASFIQSRR